MLRADASIFKTLTSSIRGYVSKANKSKETCIPTNESQIKICRVLISEWHERSKGRLYYLTYLKNITLSEFAILFTPFFRPMCSWNDWSSLECSFVGRKAMYQSKRNQSSYLGLEFQLDISANCACMTFRNCSVYIAGKKPFLTQVLLHSLSIAQVESCICCKTVTGLRKNVFFI